VSEIGNQDSPYFAHAEILWGFVAAGEQVARCLYLFD